MNYLQNPSSWQRMESAWGNDDRPPSHSHPSTSGTLSRGSLSSRPLALPQLIPQMLLFSLGFSPRHNLGQTPLIFLQAVTIARKEILFGGKLFLKGLLSLLKSHLFLNLASIWNKIEVKEDNGRFQGLRELKCLDLLFCILSKGSY